MFAIEDILKINFFFPLTVKGDMFDIMSVTQNFLFFVCVTCSWLIILLPFPFLRKKYFLLSVKTTKNNVQRTTGLHLNYFLKTGRLK